MKNNKLFVIELFLSIFFITLAVFLTGKTFYLCDNSMFLNTTDAVPLYTKVLYAADCIRSMQWPSWFPTWYCGSSVSQYYPPLTYIILTPLQLFFNNTTLCLKVYIFSGLFMGGLGVWYIFYRYIGRFLGIFAAVLYVTLPYLLLTFLFWGTLAQLPIIALTPWYFVFYFKFFDNPTGKTWIIIIFITFVLLLSHVMHGFMIALSIFVTMFIISIIQKKGISKIIIWIVGTMISVGILGFWWVIGVLPLENPGVPSLGTSAAQGFTANFLWFLPDQLASVIELMQKHFPGMTNGVDAYFPFTILIIAFVSFIFIRKEKDQKYVVLLFLYILTIFTFIFSFGYHLPFFTHLPLSNSLVPGRVLTLTAIGAVILTAYVVFKLIIILAGKVQFKKPQRAIHIRRITFYIIIILLIIIRQSYTNYPMNVVINNSLENSLYSQLDKQNTAFDKGRLATLGGNYGSIHSYFAYLYKYNIVTGWNIEGTSVADYIWFQNSALVYEKNDFILKNIYDMNVQICFVDYNDFPSLYKNLEKNGFEEIGASSSTRIMKRNSESYFMEQIRNSIVIGKTNYLFLSEYPWFVNGYSSNPSDYSIDYLNDYDVIYYCEPEIKDVAQLRNFEQQIIQLVNKGKGVFVEFGKATLPGGGVLGVTPMNCTLVDNEKIKSGYVIKSNDGLNDFGFYTGLDAQVVTGLFGLDNVLYGIKQDNSKFSVDIVGTKNVANGKVYFIGGPVTQLKGFALNYLTGIKDDSSSMKQRDKLLNSIMTNLFSNNDMYTKLDLPAFDAQNVKWMANSCEFTYQADTSKRIMASITYTPRWRVFIDGKEQKVDRVDNMLVFNVPAGSHNVVMKYTMTIYGKIGIGITVLSLVLMIFILLHYNGVIGLINRKLIAFKKYLQLPS